MFVVYKIPLNVHSNDSVYRVVFNMPYPETCAKIEKNKLNGEKIHKPFCTFAFSYTFCLSVAKRLLPGRTLTLYQYVYFRQK